MSARDDVIRWKVCLASPPEVVHRFLSTREGRERFWAVSAEETEGAIELRFGDGSVLRSRVLRDEPPCLYEIEYFGGSRATFEMAPDDDGGTLLTLTERDVPEGERAENRPGWVALLLALKAAADFGVDLRNARPGRSWRAGFVDS